MINVTQRYSILFVGPARAGKTTMMCGWYRLLRQHFQAEPVLEFKDTREFIQIYDRYEKGVQVDPTSPGVVIKVLLQCKHPSLEFELELQDYSGEDLLEAVLHPPDSREQHAPLVESLINDLKSASWIIYVTNPELILDADQKSKFDCLSFARNLPRLIYGGKDGPIENLTWYLSKGDKYSDATLQPVIAQLRNVTDNSNLSKLQLISGSAQPPKTKNKSCAVAQFEEVFSSTMAKTIQPARSRQGFNFPLTLERLWSPFTRILLSIVVLFFLIMTLWALFTFPYGLRKLPQSELAISVQSFADKCEMCQDYIEAQRLLQETNVLLKNVADSSEEEPQKRELVSKINSAIAVLKSISEPKSSQAVIREVQNVVAKHTKGTEVSLRDFYADLAQISEAACRQSTWEPAAQEEWKKLSDLSRDLIDKGFELKFSYASFSASQWWTSYWGYDDLKLEVWVTRGQSRRPFDKSTQTGANLFTPWSNPEVTAPTGQFICRWSKADDTSTSTLKFGLDDQLWIRVVDSEGANETLFEYKVIKSGPLGLSELARPQQNVMFEGRQFSFEVRLQPLVTVPQILREAFGESY